MRYSVLESFVKGILERANFRDVPITPGPALPDLPNEYVVLTPYGGPGLQVDGVFDAQSWQVRVVGRQNDYGSAEDMATAIDIAFISHESGRIGNLWVTSITRVGGAPNPLMVDNADRTNFVCNYNVEHQSALVNN